MTNSTGSLTELISGLSHKERRAFLEKKSAQFDPEATRLFVEENIPGPWSSDKALAQAQFLDREGKKEEAVEFFVMAVESCWYQDEYNSGKPRVFTYKIKEIVEASDHNLEVAEAAVRTIRIYGHQDLDDLFKAGVILRDAGDLDGANDIFHTVAEEAVKKDWRNLAADAYLELGEPELAYAELIGGKNPFRHSYIEAMKIVVDHLPERAEELSVLAFNYGRKDDDLDLMARSQLLVGNDGIARNILREQRRRFAEKVESAITGGKGDYISLLQDAQRMHATETYSSLYEAIIDRAYGRDDKFKWARAAHEKTGEEKFSRIIMEMHAESGDFDKAESVSKEMGDLQAAERYNNIVRELAPGPAA